MLAIIIVYLSYKPLLKISEADLTFDAGYNFNLYISY